MTVYEIFSMNFVPCTGIACLLVCLFSNTEMETQMKRLFLLPVFLEVVDLVLYDIWVWMNAFSITVEFRSVLPDIGAFLRLFLAYLIFRLHRRVFAAVRKEHGREWIEFPVMVSVAVLLLSAALAEVFSLRGTGSAAFVMSTIFYYMFFHTKCHGQKPDVVQEGWQEIMHAVSSSCASLLYISLKENTCQVVGAAVGAGRGTNGSDNAQEMLNQMCTEWVEPEYISSVLQFVNLSTLVVRMQKEPMISCEYEGKEHGWCKTTFLVAKREEDGTLVRVLCATQHVEKEKQKERNDQEALRVALEAAKQSEHAKREFLSQMSHDIRTPLNVIMGMASIAQTHLDDKGRLEDALRKIMISGGHLLRLVNQVLDMSKMESGDNGLAEEKFRFSELVDSLVRMVSPELKQHKHILELYFPAVEHDEVAGIPSRVKQVFLNIMRNAILYTPDGGKIVLTVTEKPTNRVNVGCYEFIVEDNGMGMSQECLDNLYEPFYRGSEVRDKIEGAGLGMSIVNNIVHMMDGYVKVTSKVGKGTCVTVTICLKLPGDRKLEEEDVLSSFRLEMSEIPDYSGKRVLLVEDDELNREVAVEVLQYTGMQIDMAEDGRQAVEKFAASADGYYDVVIMDIQMPVMDGYEATGKIRGLARQDAKTLPIIAMSADAFAADVQRAKDAGMNEHVAKPVDARGLMQVLKKWMPA